MTGKLFQNLRLRLLHAGQLMKCRKRSQLTPSNVKCILKVLLVTAVLSAAALWLRIQAAPLMLLKRPHRVASRQLLRTRNHDNGQLQTYAMAAQIAADKAGVFDSSTDSEPAAQAAVLLIALIAHSSTQLHQWQGPAVHLLCVTGAVSASAIAHAQRLVPALAGAAVHRPPAASGQQGGLHPVHCAGAILRTGAVEDSDQLLFVQGGVQLAPVALRWTRRALGSRAGAAAGGMVALASVRGMPLMHSNAPPCFDPAGRRVGSGVCAPPLDALLVHSCAAPPQALAAGAALWRQLAAATTPDVVGEADLDAALSAQCRRGSWRVAHLNLGGRLTLARPHGSNTVQLQQQWRAELDDALEAAALDVVVANITPDHKHDLGYVPEHSGTNALVRSMKRIMTTQRAPFPGLVIANAAFVEMTLHWLCQVRGMAGVLERTVVLCIDAGCIDAMRSAPVSRRLGAVAGMDMTARLQALRLELGMEAHGASLEADLKYGSQAYHLFMLTRQLILKDLVDSNVPYLLFETDAWWQRDAYAYLDAVLATGGELQPQRHPPSPPSAVVLQPNKVPFDMLLYVDVPEQDDATRLGVGGGFFLALPLPGTKRLFEEWASNVKDSVLASTHYGGTRVHETEQVMFQRLVSDRFAGFRPALLPVQLFPNGQFYHGLTSAEEAVAKVQKQGAIVIQFNYVVGAGGKVSRAKRFNQWGLTEAGTCRTLRSLPL